MLSYFLIDVNKIVVYHQEIRTALFMSGFTIGSFLFSMKTFILKTMKDDYYDRGEYHGKVLQRISLGQDVSVYGPLKKFSQLLQSAIVASFLSAFLQFTIGYFNDYRTSFFCIAMAFFSWVLVAFAIYFVGENWSKVLDISEQKFNKKS